MTQRVRNDRCAPTAAQRLPRNDRRATIAAQRLLRHDGCGMTAAA
jgi:hypothetical protein